MNKIINTIYSTVEYNRYLREKIIGEETYLTEFVVYNGFLSLKY